MGEITLPISIGDTRAVWRGSGFSVQLTDWQTPNLATIAIADADVDQLFEVTEPEHFGDEIADKGS